jgi:diadenylate cyclase
MDFSGQFRSFLERVFDRPWVTAIELLLIGTIVFTVLRLLQGTPGARLIRAVLAILGGSFAVVWLLADRFELDRINVLYPYFILAVFLASLVAFQSELRRILAKLGQGGWVQRWLITPEETIGPIVTAVGRLAKNKIGAIIAVERSDEMGPWSESGVPVEAAISAELLETIFWPGSPLHDLGLVVRQGRILAAGCQFPLAESSSVERSLGSRHRAAIGLSQESDAVVIVVSEETGTISVAIDGRLRRGLECDELRVCLLTELGLDGRTEPAKPQTGT